MSRFLLLILLTGCVSHHNPQPIDTKFREEDRNWMEVYRHEIKVAIENEDREAYYFFMQELIKERFKARGIKIPDSPTLEFY